MHEVHDMGGVHGFGPVLPEPDEPSFHAKWEGRMLAMQRATGYIGLWTIDAARAAIESLPPDIYLSASYYEKWALGVEKCLIAHDLVGADEIAAGHSLRPGKTLARKLMAADIDTKLKRGSYDRPAPAPARFKHGDRVRAKRLNPSTHTRLPRYARGHVGMIEAIRGCHVFPDTAAIGKGENPHWLYTVVFDGRELWGDAAEPALKVSIEAWEPYLEPA
jgi:nitrile hydratase subunit beta